MPGDERTDYTGADIGELIGRLRKGCSCNRCKWDACCCSDMDEAADVLLSMQQAEQAMFEKVKAKCASIAKTGWVSADYNVVGIVDADKAMLLCEHIETAIEAIRQEDL